MINPNNSTGYQRRHSRWYERLLFSLPFQYLLGFVLVVLLPGWFRWWGEFFVWPLSKVELNTLLANAVAFTLAFFILRQCNRYPGTRSLPFILPTVLLSWLLVFSVLLFIREEVYARQVLIYSGAMAFVWAFVGYLLGRRYLALKLAVLPFGHALKLEPSAQANLNFLERPDLGGRRFDAVVADLHSDDLPDEWERFLARCALSNIPVFHIQQLLESLTGRVAARHLTENQLGNLAPSAFYMSFKRLWESLLILLAAPVWLPVMLLTGIIIKLESTGPMFFVQNRVGLGNRDFRVYKLRSMCKDSEKDGAQFAAANDMRITRVGRFIRKTRLDELPQFVNVLKGDMSLIGPRPEQRTFVDQFEQQIPFYSYRHVVRPGITGWAQVVHGYAADCEDTRVKLEHDLYYIKHYSLWLDILIVAKTIRTILTGFGAR